MVRSTKKQKKRRDAGRTQPKHTPDLLDVILRVLVPLRRVLLEELELLLRDRVTHRRQFLEHPLPVGRLAPRHRHRRRRPGRRCCPAPTPNASPSCSCSCCAPPAACLGGPQQVLEVGEEGRLSFRGVRGYRRDYRVPCTRCWGWHRCRVYFHILRCCCCCCCCGERGRPNGMGCG